MKRIADTQYILNFDENNPPVARVSSGETIVFSCMDCFHNQMDSASVLKSNLLQDGMVINPVAGPVYIEGAMPGDTLKVRLDDVEITRDFGTFSINQFDFRAVKQHITEEEGAAIPIEDGFVNLFDGKLQLPVRLNVGVLGVAPKGEPISTLQPGAFGGNLDCKHFTKGTTMYLPVFVEGALLAAGDIHALQSDGEMPCALEVPGNITVTVELIKGRQEAWPVLETDDAWYVITAALTSDEANMTAAGAMADFLVRRSDMYEPKEWAILLAMAGDLEICQVANPWVAIRYKMPKSVTKDMVF